MKRYLTLFSILFTLFAFQASTVSAQEGGWQTVKPKGKAKKPKPNTTSDRNVFNHDSAMAVLNYAKGHSFAAPAYHQGNTAFDNAQHRLPTTVGITYKEYDIYQLVKSVPGVANIDRGNCRVIIAVKDGKFLKGYSTSDHYASFTELK